MKPIKCPFCGNKKSVEVQVINGDITIGYTICGFHGHAFKTKIAAIRAWNKRFK
jgi:transcription elongation factor Elf1